ncbi:neuropeptide Y receptor type 6 [Eurytemora carolleeae]|uniref:neuropeptide Y receptor type 6 n=1 Tax=Eurytemora carolleeae TaxID=1294199 RepID=UPI000C77F5BC|nr:neuropeptide Y receptor type 6 [Eurytemora carolleeae]|eukprot:XP_023320933.1 neuropeptide Y receptor type 6-like [Eurytemora affinis]
MNRTEEDLGIDSSINVEEEINKIIQTFQTDNVVLDKPTRIICIILYTCIFSCSVLLNLLVVVGVTRRREMRTTRNIFILQLSLADLLLVLTLPFTLTDVLHRTWILGNSPFLCRLTKTVPLVAVFCSSISIMVIAVDRYIVITKNYTRKAKHAWFSCGLTALFGTILAIPVFVRTGLYNMKEVVNNMRIMINGQYLRLEEYPDSRYKELENIHACIQDWRVGEQFNVSDRIWFTLFSTLLQFIIPLVVISTCYCRISIYLQANRHPCQRNSANQRKTNLLLFLISLIFSVR